MELNSNPKVTAKQLTLAVAALVLTLADWLLIRAALYGNQPLVFWFWPLGAFILTIAAMAFFSLVRPGRLLVTGVHLAGLIGYLLVMPKDPFVILGGALYFLLSVIFSGWIAREGENLLSFSVTRTVGTTQTALIYGILLLLGLNIYYNTSQDFKRNPDQFYGKITDSVARGIPYFSENISPGTDLNQSLDQYLLTQTRDTGGASLSQLPPSEQRSVLGQARTEFSKQFGIQAAGSETMSVVVSRIVTERVRGMLDRFGKYFPIIFTLIVVALLRTFMFVFNWLSLLVSWLIYRLLLWVNFFRLERVAIEVQKLRL